MALNTTKLIAPLRDKVVDQSGLFSFSWQKFFQKLYELVIPLGREKKVTLANDQSAAADIEGLSFDKSFLSHAAVDYLIQRVTTASGATELVTGGTFYLVYKPTSDAWAISGGPTTVGITLSVTAAGQVQYTSTNITGTPSISRIVWRARILEAKSYIYSSVGGG